MEEKKPQWTMGYKEVKNFIHNEEGMTKEQLKGIMTEIAKNEVAEAVGKNGEFIRHCIRDIIRQEMMLAMNDEKYPRVDGHIWMYPEKDNFKQFIINVMKEEIINSLRDQFDFTFDFEKKDK